MKKIFLSITLLLFSVNLSFSQLIDFKRDISWFDLGVGGFASKGSPSGVVEGYSMYSSFNIKTDKFFLKARYVYNFEFEFHFFANPIPPSEVYHSFGVLAGKGFSNDIFELQFSGGFGLLKGEGRGETVGTRENTVGGFAVIATKEYTTQRFISPSLLLDVDFMIKPLRFWGVGVTLFADISYQRQICGLVLKTGFGKLRK